MEGMPGEIPHNGADIGLVLSFATDLLPKGVSVTTVTPASEGKDILVAGLEDAVVPCRLPIDGACRFFSDVVSTRPCPSPSPMRPAAQREPRPRSISRADAAGSGSSGSAGSILLGVFTGGSLAADADLGGNPRSALNFGDTTEAN